MQDKVKILHLEDNAADAELVQIQLRETFSEAEIKTVRDEKSFVDQLESHQFNIILSDYNIPGFNGMEALKFSLSKTPKTPFIFISGTIGEERAVEALRLGATDYVLKENLAKLPYVIQRALREKQDQFEKEQQEREVFHAYQLLESVFDNTQMQVAYLDVNFNFLKVNKAYAVTEGKTPDYFVGKNHFDLFPNVENQEIFREVLRTGKPHITYARPFIDKLNPLRGTTYWDWSLAATRDISGNTNGLVVTLLEVSDRIKSEKALIESEERLSLATTATGLGTYDWHVKQNPFWDTRMHEIFDLDPSSDVDRNVHFFTVLHPDDAERVKNNYHLFLDKESSSVNTYKDIFRILRPDGSTRYVSSFGSCQRDKTGEIIRITGTCLDVTAQRVAEEELRQSEIRQRAILQAIPDIMFTVSKDGVYLSHQFNVETEHRLLAPWKEMIGKRKHAFMKHETAEKQIEKIRQAIKTGIPQTLDYSLQEKDGERFYESRYVKLTDDTVLQIIRDLTEKKKSERDLLESEKRFRQLAETIKEVFWLTDWETRESLYVSPAYEEVYGYSVESLMNDSKSWTEHVHPDDREWVKEEYYRNAEKGTYNVEFRVVHPDGSIKWVQERAFPIRENNRIVRMAGYSVDITERKQAERELMFTTDILNRVSSLVAVVNKQAEIVYISPSARNMLGYRPEELLGKNWWKLTTFNKTHQNKEEKNVKRILKDGLMIFDRYYEREFKTKSGVVKWIGWDQTETPDGLLICVGQDITARKETERSLAQSELRYRTLFEQMNEGLLFSSDDGEILFANKKFADMVGYSMRELKGANGYKLLIDPEDLKDVSGRVKDRKRGFSEQYELRMRRKDGKYIWVRISASPNVDSDNNFLGVMSLVSDITESKLTEDQLKRERLQGLQYHSKLLSSQINPHFIFNALNSVQYYILDRNTEPALNFISEFSKLMRATLQNSMHKYISISEEIDFLKIYLELETKRYNDKFTYEISVSPKIDPEEFYIPPMLLQPYIENTVVHGLGNKPDQGKVKINFSRRKDQLICTISDNGIGREKAMELRKLRVGNTQHRSLGMNILDTRIKLLRELTGKNFGVEIKDLYDKNKKPAGTCIKVIIPMLGEDVIEEPDY